MIKTKKDLQYYMTRDSERILYKSKYSKKFSKFWYVIGLISHIEYYRCLHLVRLLRLYEYALNNKSNNIYSFLRYLFRRIQYNRVCLKYNTHIGPNMAGPGLRIIHLGGVILNCLSAGENLTITQGVVVGKKGSNDNRPTIGNDVELTLGCKVIGRITIGDGVIVAPNSVVVKDVPAYCAVSGVPANVIKKYT